MVVQEIDVKMLADLRGLGLRVSFGWTYISIGNLTLVGTVAFPFSVITAVSSFSYGTDKRKKDREDCKRLTIVEDRLVFSEDVGYDMLFDDSL